MEINQRYPKEFFHVVKQTTYKKKWIDDCSCKSTAQKTIPYDLVGDSHDSYAELQAKGIIEIIGSGYIHTNNRGEIVNNPKQRIFFNYVK